MVGTLMLWPRRLRLQRWYVPCWFCWYAVRAVLCSLWSSSGLRCLHRGRYGPEGQFVRASSRRRLGSGMCSAGIAGYFGDDAPRAVFYFLVVRPKMVGV